MARATLSLMLIFALLICPIRCASAASTGGEDSAPVCKCCHKHLPVQRDGKSPCPTSSEGGGNCLCHGAIVAIEAPLPPSLQVSSLSLFTDSLVDRSTVEFTEVEAALQFKPPNTGQVIRLQLSSLLL